MLCVKQQCGRNGRCRSLGSEVGVDREWGQLEREPGTTCGEPCMSCKKSACVMLFLVLLLSHHLCCMKERNLTLVDENVIFIGKS